MSFPNKVFDTMRVKVFHFTVYDVNRDEMVVPGQPGHRSKRTLDDIRANGGIPVEGSEELIEPSQLDGYRRYYPASA